MCAGILYGFAGLSILKSASYYIVHFTQSFIYLFILAIFILLHRALDPSLLCSAQSSTIHVQFLLKIMGAAVHTVFVTFLSPGQHTRQTQFKGWRIYAGLWFQRVSVHHSRADMIGPHYMVAGL